MKIIKVANYEEMSLVAFSILEEKLKLNAALNIGFATGGTPLGLYEHLVAANVNKEITFKDVKSFNLDEYVGLSKTNPNSYHYFMFDNLFNHIDINKNNVHIPNGETLNIEEECASYERLIKKYGGIDIQILGIGGNGHIAFNEPGTSFESVTHIVDLDESTRQANARFFENINEVPTKAVTMGLSTIMNSKEILLLVNGEKKKEAFQELISGNISEQFPASILHKHPNVIVIVDEEAYSE
ncbi:glucosamine-6-phosphate deaminase [Bacillus cereus]|uniref:glucosamine-6-phosphate deaminase n=1 Tax=Bacillus cereus TaxID=1396 RepID=UPI00307975E4